MSKSGKFRIPGGFEYNDIPYGPAEESWTLDVKFAYCSYERWIINRLPHNKWECTFSRRSNSIVVDVSHTSLEGLGAGSRTFDTPFAALRDLQEVLKRVGGSLTDAALKVNIK